MLGGSGPAQDADGHIRNLAIGTLKLAGHASIAAAARWRPWPRTSQSVICAGQRLVRIAEAHLRRSQEVKIQILDRRRSAGHDAGWLPNWLPPAVAPKPIRAPHAGDRRPGVVASSPDCSTPRPICRTVIATVPNAVRRLSACATQSKDALR